MSPSGEDDVVETNLKSKAFAECAEAAASLMNPAVEAWKAQGCPDCRKPLH